MKVTYLIVLLSLVAIFSLIGESYASESNDNGSITTTQVNHPPNAFVTVSIRVDTTVLPHVTHIGCEKLDGFPADSNYKMQTVVKPEKGGYVFGEYGESFYKIPKHYKYLTINIWCISGTHTFAAEGEPVYIHTLADGDGDGIPDISDYCPLQDETINKFEDTDGCADDYQPIEIDLNFNKDTKDISISWNFGENRESCHAKTNIWINDNNRESYHYFGKYNNELIPGHRSIGISDNEKIDCSGDMTLNFRDFTDVEVTSFGFFMNFAMKEFQTQQVNLAELGFIYRTTSNPQPITCGVANHFDSFSDFVDLVVGPNITIKTKVVDSFCESGIPQPFIQFSDGIHFKYINPELQKKKSNGGCADCTPPTLGLDKTYKRIVDDGFSYNGNMVQVEKWYTEFPLINATVGVPNLVEIKVYENTGITNMKWVQFCLGAEERGQPLNSCEVLIEAHLLTNGTTTGVMVEDIVITDKENLIDNDTVTAVSYVVSCMEYGTEPNCVKVDLEYTYREETFNHMLIVNVLDKARNSQNFHFNEGVNVLGESLNESPTITLFAKHASQQKDDLYITYTRTDKITDTWVDQNGIEYHRINDVTFDRITPADSYECTDPTLDKVKVWKRTNCHFRALTDLWSYN